MIVSEPVSVAYTVGSFHFLCSEKSACWFVRNFGAVYADLNLPASILATETAVNVDDFSAGKAGNHGAP
jgi:hypothetical protein